MALRVVHCGSGGVGTSGLAGIIGHPDLELVGQYVWSPEKVGVDSGVLCGLGDTGVRATVDSDECSPSTPTASRTGNTSVARSSRCKTSAGSSTAAPTP